MRIALGADHGGYALKEQLSLKLRAQSHQVIDLGTSSNEAVDFPVFARRVAEVPVDLLTTALWGLLGGAA